MITGTEIQGRFGNGQGMEFAESYLVSYWRPTINKWIRYRDRNGNEVRCDDLTSSRTLPLSQIVILINRGIKK